MPLSAPRVVPCVCGSTTMTVSHTDDGLASAAATTVARTGACGGWRETSTGVCAFALGIQRGLLASAAAFMGGPVPALQAAVVSGRGMAAQHLHAARARPRTYGDPHDTSHVAVNRNTGASLPGMPTAPPFPQTHTNSPLHSAHCVKAPARNGNTSVAAARRPACWHPRPPSSPPAPHLRKAAAVPLTPLPDRLAATPPLTLPLVQPPIPPPQPPQPQPPPLLHWSAGPR